MRDDVGTSARRCSRVSFAKWMLPWLLLLAVGAFACLQCLIGGLQNTNMDNRYAFGLWIFLDLTVIALGAGAFTSGILVYVLRWREAKDLIQLAVVVGVLCYSGAIGILMVDVGQPLRAWFTFWHPNVHSMLAEVTFCLTCYLAVLIVEVIPVITRQRRLRRSGAVAALGTRLHRSMVIMALVGATLSFFHQGSLGGLFGVLQGRPFAYREALAIWPTTFFLFVLSAVAVGPAFLVLVARAMEAVTSRRLVPVASLDRLARLSGNLLLVYLVLKTVDTLVWLNRTVPDSGVHPYWLFREPPFDRGILVLEMLVLGLIPALLLRRSHVGFERKLQTLGALAACLGIALNRGIATLQTLALPTLPFEPRWSYVPSLQEVAAFCAVIAYTVIALSLAHRYLNLFPRERDLDRVSGR